MPKTDGISRVEVIRIICRLRDISSSSAFNRPNHAGEWNELQDDKIIVHDPYLLILLLKNEFNMVGCEIPAF